MAGKKITKNTHQASITTGESSCFPFGKDIHYRDHFDFALSVVFAVEAETNDSQHHPQVQYKPMYSESNIADRLGMRVNRHGRRAIFNASNFKLTAWARTRNNSDR